ncbi:hypothetical protein BGX27_006200 [Mortierella sp. AM989]|nr:hypothetical protein BGX27_006200 [Mortierella sp. AM989]
MESPSKSNSSSHRRDHDRKEGRDRDRDRDREKDRKHRHHDRDDHSEDNHKKHKSSSSSKSRHHDREDGDGGSKRHHHKSSSSRHDRDKERSSSSRRKEENSNVDLDDEDMWVEKDIPGVDQTSIQTKVDAPMSSDLAQSSGDPDPSGSDNAVAEASDVTSKRDSWMMDDGGMDFGLMGALRVKKPKEEKPDPSKRQVSSRELNVHLKAGLQVDQYPEVEKPSYTIGDAGSSWRMTKLRRVMETAAEEGVAPEIIGVERFGSIEKFDEAMDERRELDRRAARKKERRNDRYDDRRDDRKDNRRDSRKGDDRRNDRDHDDDERRGDDDRRSNWEDRSSLKSGRLSEFSSAASSPFQRPMDEQERLEKEIIRRNKEKEREKDKEKRHTPIPSPFATHVSSPIPNHSAEPIMTQDQLNKLKAKAMRAKMMGLPDADVLEKEYDQAQKAAADSPSRSPAAEAQRTVVIQTMGHSSGASSPVPLGPGNRKVTGKKKEVTHDEQGNRIGYQGEEGDLDLHELVRREKLGLEEGMDKELARRITRDAVFRDDLDYMDDNADKIARTVKKNDAQLKSTAIHDYRKTQSALDNCPMCFKNEGQIPPVMPVVSMGNRVYLGLPLHKEFLPGHCMIVPIQHVTSTLECDDDDWDEIRNFMKCLIQMNAAQDQSVIFSETVINLKWHKHTVIECIPIPWDAGQTAPGYFKEAILSADEEWSQHRKLIETDAKDSSNGGFRRRLTSKLPYFHVWLGSPDKGYGHVIENSDKFEEYFVKEVLASICEMDSLQWSRRNNKRIPVAENTRRVEAFKKSWQPWDWTKTLESNKK